MSFETNDSIRAMNELVKAMDYLLKTMSLKDGKELKLKIILDCKFGTLFRYERHFGDWEED